MVKAICSTSFGRETAFFKQPREKAGKRRCME
jgi:hypothetical protein